MGLERNLIVVPFVGKFTFKCKTTSWVACLRPRPCNSAAFLRWYSDFQSSPTHRAKESRLYIPRTCARSSFAVQNSCNNEHASPGNKANYTLCAGSKLKVCVYIFQFCIPKQESLEMRLYIYTLVFLFFFVSFPEVCRTMWGKPVHASGASHDLWTYMCGLLLVGMACAFGYPLCSLCFMPDDVILTSVVSPPPTVALAVA